MKSIARTAPNIALVKYWGKADEARVLPLNSSVSLTLGRALQTQTRASLTPGPDSLLINGRPSPITPRAATVIAFFKSQFRENANFEIVSTNLGPTASGMASSASGLSALVLALNGLLQSPLPFDKISELTRLGSGSAIRSLKGGLVEWRAAEAGSTSSGIIQHMKSEDLKDLRVAALVEEVGEKDVKSSAGMKLTMETSLLARQRPKIAEDHVQQVVQAIRGKDYRKLSQLVRRESNMLHALCLDTLPPLFYLTQFSRHKIRLVEQWLLPLTDHQVAYTFDAGSHCFLVYPQAHERTIFTVLQGLYPGLQGLPPTPAPQAGLQRVLERLHSAGAGTHRPQRVIVSEVGTDPEVELQY